jgi:hypothetical protein
MPDALYVQHFEQLNILISIVWLCRSSHVISGSLFIYFCTENCFFQRNLPLWTWTHWTSKSETFFELGHRVPRLAVLHARLLQTSRSHTSICTAGSCWLLKLHVSGLLDTRVGLYGFCGHQSAIVLLHIIIKRLEQLLPAKLFGFAPLRCTWDSCWTKRFRVRFFSEYFCFPMATEGYTNIAP